MEKRAYHVQSDHLGVHLGVSGVGLGALVVLDESDTGNDNSTDQEALHHPRHTLHLNLTHILRRTINKGCHVQRKAISLEIPSEAEVARLHINYNGHATMFLMEMGGKRRRRRRLP